MENIFKEHKVTIIAAIVLLVAIAVITIFGGSPGDTTVSDNGRVDQSKKVKSNVGDTTIGGDNVQLDGINAGGDFNLNLGK